MPEAYQRHVLGRGSGSQRDPGYTLSTILGFDRDSCEEFSIAPPKTTYGLLAVITNLGV